MRIIEISPLSNGAHRNQTSNTSIVPEGWAVIPDNMETLNYPFGTITVADVNGVMTVTSWAAGTIPEPEPAPESEPTIEDDMLETVLDHEIRLSELELLGGGE